MEGADRSGPELPSLGALGGRPAPLFGRAEVMDEILHLLDAVRDGSGRVLLLVGLGGVG